MNGDMSGYTYTGPSWKERQDEQQWRQRIADLEQALCGLCQQMTETGDPNVKRNLHPDLQAWLDKHKQRSGGVV